MKVIVLLSCLCVQYVQLCLKNKTFPRELIKPPPLSPPPLPPPSPPPLPSPPITSAPAERNERDRSPKRADDSNRIYFDQPVMFGVTLGALGISLILPIIFCCFFFVLGNRKVSERLTDVEAGEVS